MKLKKFHIYKNNFLNKKHKSIKLKTIKNKKEKKEILFNNKLTQIITMIQIINKVKCVKKMILK